MYERILVPLVGGKARVRRLIDAIKLARPVQVPLYLLHLGAGVPKALAKRSHA